MISLQGMAEKGLLSYLKYLELFDIKMDMPNFSFMIELKFIKKCFLRHCLIFNLFFEIGDGQMCRKLNRLTSTIKAQKYYC